MRLARLHLDRYTWDLRIQVSETHVPAFGNGVLKQIGFDVNPLWERGELPESRLHLMFDLDRGSMTPTEDRDAIRRLKEYLDLNFQPTTDHIRVRGASFGQGVTGSFRVPLTLPRCNFSEHAVELLHQVIAAWEIRWCSPGLHVTRETVVKVKRGLFSWVGFGQYLEMKAKGEL